MNRKLVTAAAGLAILTLSLPTAAFAAGRGASDCQPEAGQRTAAIAHQLGGLGQAVSAVATSQPGAIAALNKQDLFNCTEPAN